MIYTIVQTPPGSTIEKTYSVMRWLEEVALKIEGVDSVATSKIRNSQRRRRF